MSTLSGRSHSILTPCPRIKSNYENSFNAGSGSGLLGYSVFPDWYANDPINDGIGIISYSTSHYFLSS